MTDTNNISIKRVEKSRLENLDFENLSFGRDFADHLFVCKYSNGKWGESRIEPYANISMAPSIAVLHYGQTIFEGMKAQKNDDGDIFIFRPEKNVERMNKSAVRLGMPEISEEIFVEGLKELLKIDREWVPNKTGSSLYIRPFMFAIDEYIGVRSSDEYIFMIITSPVGSYYSEPLRVKVETEYIRAAEGGVGFAKAAGNYAGSLLPAKKAMDEGYHQIIWTDAKEHKYIEESGTMNLMFIIDGIIITPPAGNTILDGVTRDSALTIAKDLGYKVEERRISIDEVIEAHGNGTLEDAFGTGTAVTITHIKTIGFNGTDYELPAIDTREKSLKMLSQLEAIKLGKGEDPHNWVVKI
ncbi:MAG: branched-chain amino acid aminotransferase [Flavobacteriales bacterium]|nr:branched-chain amino acid aminotransferase [Flavobacteriales bacterium]